MEGSTTETDLLIVGAGPSGLALAAELKRLGVSALIVDGEAAGRNTSRAAVIHARTLEVLTPLGVVPPLLGEGIKAETFHIRDRDHALVTIGFAGLPSPYPFALLCPQDRTEHVLLTALQKAGGTVERPWRFTGFERDGAAIVAHLESEDRRRDIRTRWLIGCDGMHSKVREAAAIPFAGAAYEQSFVLADVRMASPLRHDEVNLYLSAGGLLLVAPLPDASGDRFRIVATADTAPEVPSIADVQALLDARGPTGGHARVREVVWSSRFRVHHRIAGSPRQGHVLLCGDAAHVHSPAGGQGMNTGIQDAISLAGVLTETLRDGDETRLDAWATERHRIATKVVRLTDRLTRIGTAKSALGRSLRNAGMVLAGSLPPMRAAIARTLAELNN